MGYDILNGGLSLYIKVADKIRNDIFNEDYKIGEKFPSESELAKRYNVSRNTIREALSVLESEGLVTRKHGVGTFITSKKPSTVKGKGRRIGFTERQKKLGKTPGTLALTFEWEPADLRMSKILHIPMGSLLGVIKRIRSVDGIPMLYAIDKLPEKLIGPDFKPEDMGESLLTFLYEKKDIKFVKSEICVRAVITNRIISEKLKMSGDIPLLMVEETHYPNDRKSVLWSVNYFRSDIYEFNITSLWEQQG